MADIYNNLQVVLMGKQELIYREFHDTNGNKVDPIDPLVRIYDPEGARVSSAAVTKETTGVYFYNVDLDSSNPEGMYQAYWEGTIGGYLVTMDVPQYFWLQKVPHQLNDTNAVINSVRRMIGDMNPNNYKISPQDMFYYLSDAVDEVQMTYNMGYTVAVTPISLTFNKTLTRLAASLFKIKCAEIILTSTLFDVLFDGANLHLGDIRINMRDTIAGRRDLRKELKTDFDNMIKKLKISSGTGYVVDTYLYNRYGEV